MAIVGHHFRFRTMTNKSYTFHRRHLRPAHFGGVHACICAAEYYARSFPNGNLKLKCEKIVQEDEMDLFIIHIPVLHPALNAAVAYQFLQ